MKGFASTAIMVVVLSTEDIKGEIGLVATEEKFSKTKWEWCSEFKTIKH